MTDSHFRVGKVKRKVVMAGGGLEEIFELAAWLLLWLGVNSFGYWLKFKGSKVRKQEVLLLELVNFGWTFLAWLM